MSLRIADSDKAAITEAAKLTNQSVTKFITDAALKQARSVQRKPPSHGIHGGVPTFFRASCYEASRGGTGGYIGAGLRLTGSLGSQIPNDIDNDDWEAEVASLHRLFVADDDESVWQWFKRHYPKCMTMVPVRRRHQFLAGARKAYENGNVEV